MKTPNPLSRTSADGGATGMNINYEQITGQWVHENREDVFGLC